jgi:hypothetical protein
MQRVSWVVVAQLGASPVQLPSRSLARIGFVSAQSLGSSPFRRPTLVGTACLLIFCPWCRAPHAVALLVVVSSASRVDDSVGSDWSEASRAQKSEVKVGKRKEVWTRRSRSFSRHVCLLPAEDPLLSLPALRLDVASAHGPALRRLLARGGRRRSLLFLGALSTVDDALSSPSSLTLSRRLAVGRGS